VRRGTSIVLVIVVLAVIVMAGGGWGVLTYTAQPAFCNSCHIMNTRFVSWQRSAHSSAATCIECHSEPGTWEEIKAHLNGARYLYVMLTGEKSGPLLRAEVSDASCLQCHPRTQLPEVIHTHRVLHDTHLSRNVSCTDCHAGLVHGTLYGGQARPPMQLCMDCHAQRSPLLTACETCHLQPTGPAVFSRLPR
jgi:nitrate/TMAO reductase-like tetraheme cytochrome c subunit